MIDIPLSNCINSGLWQIYVVTQFNSVSLHRHIQSYSFDHFRDGFVEILAAQQTSGNGTWYQGTADAVRQNFSYLRQRDVDYVLILSGDQLYRMDFQKMIDTHVQANADVTIAAVPVGAEQASGLGIMRLDDTGRVIGFLEKPQTVEELEHVRTDPDWITAQGIPANGRNCLASMGIYLFNRKTLFDVLEKTNYTDFGKEVFPASIRSQKVQVHLFDGYWEDIGTIRSFYEANLSMTQANPPFVLSTHDRPTYTRARFLPSTLLNGATIRQSLIADGGEIGEGAVIENSIIGLRCKIGKNAVIRNSIIMGNDYYLTDKQRLEDEKLGLPHMGIADNARIEGAIVDKNCRIGNNVTITNPKNVQDSEEFSFGMIRDGVICIEKEAVIPNGFSLTQRIV